jgi:hypothetical protein
MDRDFQDSIKNLEQKYRKLMSMSPIEAEKIPNNTPKGGVYLFTENGVHLYVGRTKREIYKRVRNHFSGAENCPIAWYLVLKQTGKKPGYTKKDSKKNLLSNNKSVHDAYYKAMERTRKMKVRYIQEDDPLRQALLEIYVAIATKAKRNDFDTH